MERKNKIIYTFFLVLISMCMVSFFSFSQKALAETAPHLIINEIQTAGTTSTEEFIELFNPTEESISISGYKLGKKTKGGTESTLLSSSTSTKFSGTIAAHGYFLISHPTYKDKVSADLAYASSNSIASDNTILLYDKAGTLLDKVGLGAAADFETAPAINPGSSQSVARRNFADTDNNAADFSLNTSPSPQNSTVFENNNEEDPQINNDNDQSETENNDNIDQNSSKKCDTSSKDIKLNEIFPYPDNSEEFVEITNIGASCVDVSGWKIMDEAGHKKIFPENSALRPKQFLTLEGNLYLNNDSDTVYLLDTGGNTKDDALDSVHYEKAKKNFSYSFGEKSWHWTTTPTPGIENLITEEKVPANNENICEKDKCPEKVFLSEILANPKKDEQKNEYIEIINQENDKVDLMGWTLRDASKTGKFVFKEHTLLDPGKYLALYRPETKLALNNSAESVYLLNPAGELTSSATWQKAPDDVSYNFDGKSWHWSKFLTPGKKNKFDNPPEIKIIKPNNIYKNMAASFSAKAKDKETKKLKYVWDFGDGHKSYLAETSHKYIKKRNYLVQLKVSDASQDVVESFNIQVKSVPRPDIKITKIVPNPTGLDSQNETISLLNNSAKKVNLLNYKIATGPDPKKLANHPVTSEIILAPGEEKIITRADSKIVLNNKADEVALLYPDGKVADSVEYSKEKIEDNEAYAMLGGEWQWLLPENKNELAEASQDNLDGIVAGAKTENKTNYDSFYSGYTLEDYFIFLSALGLFRNAEEKINCCQKNHTYPSPAYLLIARL